MTTWLARAGTHETNPFRGWKNHQNGISGSSKKWLWNTRPITGPLRVRVTRYTRWRYPGRVKTAT